ncbi:MAG: glyceraldehyde 3-phosphate dehydrogenase NAD-binding domain-containing protein, partial [bacterium]|nr:glyceraldehyde 3-phosphate dehydrogenase NAD-binding domain-containing protein [bacterium]
MRIAINGFGRIGRTFFRLAFGRPASPAGGPELDIIAINDLGDLDNLAYLLKYDSVYRQYDKDVKTEKGEKNYLIVDDKKVVFLHEKDPAKLPWKALAIDVAVESTGAFESYEKAAAHITAGAKRAVITAPAKGPSTGSTGSLQAGSGQAAAGKTILLGINEDEFKTCKITSNGSCTTNAVHPVAQIMFENPGVKKALLNTIHAYTATQKTVDGPDAKDWRRGRAAAVNMVPSTTGAAISVTEAVTGLKGLFDGIAVRVPMVTGSLADFTFVAARPTSVEEINGIFREAAQSPRWKGILKVVEEPIVSSDIIGETHASIVDLSFTKVVDGDLVKVLAWYDNEWGYS